MSSPDARAHASAGLLSPEAMAALGLRRQPFDGPAADDGGDGTGGPSFADDTTAEQLADIRQALITGDDLLLILGPPGAGKSTLLAQLAADSGQRIQCFSVRGGPRFSTHNLFVGVLEAFRERPPEELREVLDALVPHLQRMAGDNVLCTVVLDDADRVPEAELTRLLSGMLYLNSRDETLLRIALSATEAFEERIPELLPEGADLPYSGLVVEAFGADRAAAYLDFRLNRAGRHDAFPFSDRDVEAINARADGRPSALHAEAARELDSRHGGDAEELPPELREPGRRGGDSGGGGLAALLQAREGKLVLGALALALILGGLLLTRPSSAPEEDEPRYRVVEEGAVGVAGGTDAEESRLELVRELDREPGGDESAAASAPASEGASGAASPVATQSPTGRASDARGTPIVTESLAAAATDSPDRETDGPAPARGADTAGAGGAAGGAGSTGADAAPRAPAPSPPPAPAPATVAEAPPEPAAAPEPDVRVATAEPDPVTPAAEPVPRATELPPATAAALPAPDASAAVDALESPNWVLVQDPDRFTVQMSASTERASVERFLSDTGLAAPNSIFAFDRDGTTWYALVHGLFDDIEEARLAIERMPEQAQTNQPWIRGVGRIQSALKTGN